MKILWSYIKQYRLTALTLLLFFAIFAVVLYLYNIDTGAVLYAAALCAVAGTVISAVHFIYYLLKHKTLENISENVTLLTDNLPEPKNLIESDYTQMLQKLQKIRTEELTRANNSRSESMDYFTAWVHQIKAPIAAMRLILQSNDTDENKELLSELFRIEQYTQMVLSFFRLDDSTSDFVFENCSLDDIIRSSIRKFAPQFVRRKIGLKYNGTEAAVLTDKKWLAFVLEQLLSNAIKYTDSGCVSISVNDKKILSVSDTGIGIAPEDLPRIFEKGFTGYNGRGDKKSTGLGLYLCKKAADKLSVSVCATSVLGEGSTFYLDLDVKELEVE